jgi:hypothetical protein
MVAPNSKFLSLKLPPDLKISLERDAAALGISISAAARLRLRSGHIPKFDTGAALVGLPTHLSALEAARAAKHL